MIGGLSIDTGFIYALLTKSDTLHAAADSKKELLETSKVILP